jgi:hypothetical protein
LLPGRSITRTPLGRLTIKKEAGEDFGDRVALPYLLASAVVVAVAGWLAGVPRGDQYWRGYVIYG